MVAEMINTLCHFEKEDVAHLSVCPSFWFIFESAATSNQGSNASFLVATDKHNQTADV